MADMINTKQKMPMQDPEARIHNFNEVALGYDKDSAVKEASRCLHCPSHPCVDGCPVKIDIPNFIEKIKNNDIDGAYHIISLSSSFPAICGRVCPQESQCEAKCVRGIKGQPVSIGALERYVADNYSGVVTNNNKDNGIKVAVVGSGPSSLACAGDLAKKGYKISVFEALHRAGGVLVYGIPEFRLPKKIVEKEIEGLKQLGVEINTNVVVGKTISIEELLENFSTIYIGTGAGLPNFMNIKGETLSGVYSANEFLTRSNLMKAYEENSDTPIIKAKKVAVVGGGNVAMDAARTALRLGAEKVYVIYRRSMQELPARKEEVEHAIEEGIEFHLLNNPIEILGHEEGNNKGFVKAIRCLRMKLGEPDESGRRRPVEIEGSQHDIEVDCVVIAIGTSPNPLIKNTNPDIETNKKGCVVIDEGGKTSKEKVYAGGDVVTGSATVISAMAAGRLAAKSIDEYLKNENK